MLKLPKTVQISGKTYNVRRDKKRWGGTGRTGKQEIVVGTRNDQSSHRKFENYVHEVAEVVACERHLRYEASDEEVVLVMNHKQFDAFANDVAAALWPMVRSK